MKACPPGCLEHAEHYYVIAVEVGPMASIPVEGIDHDQLFRRTADLVATSHTDAAVSGGFFSAETLGYEGD